MTIRIATFQGQGLESKAGLKLTWPIPPEAPATTARGLAMFSQIMCSSEQLTALHVGYCGIGLFEIWRGFNGFSKGGVRLRAGIKGCRVG